MKKLILLIATLYIGTSYGAEGLSKAFYTCFESSTKITPTISKVRVSLANQQHKSSSFVEFYDNKNRPYGCDMSCVPDGEFLKCRLVDDGGTLFMRTQNYIILSKNKNIQTRFNGNPSIVQIEPTYIRPVVHLDKTSQFNKKSFTLYLTNKCD